MTRYESFPKITAEELLARRQIFRKISQSSDEQGIFLTDSLDDLTESDIFDDDSEHFGQLRRRSSKRRAMEMQNQSGSWLMILKKLGILMELLSRMPLPPASVGGIAGATLLMTFLGPRALVQTLVYPIYRHLIGCLYPAYSSYKAVRSKNVREYVKWMMYWIVFAMFTCLETVADVFVSWIPFYYEAKVLIVLWLLSPTTKGSSMIYKKFLHPALSRREQEIDEVISKARDRGYHTVLQLGSKGVNYATNVIVQTALKSSGGLMHQLRKTHSLSDIPESEQPNWPAVTEAGDPVTEEELSIEEQPALVLRKKIGPASGRQRPVSYSDDGSQEKIGGVYKISRKKSDESGYSSSGVSEPGTPRKKEEGMPWTSKGSTRKPATIEEDSELYMDNASEDFLPKQQGYPSPNLVFKNTTQEIPTSESYHYKNVTITDVTNEGATHAKTIVSDIVNKTDELLGRITPIEEKNVTLEQDPKIAKEISTNVPESTVERKVEVLDEKSSISEEVESKIVPKEVNNTSDHIMEQVPEVKSEVADQNIPSLVQNHVLIPPSKESLENDTFFDIKNESIDSEDFIDCENVVSGNISIKITQETVPLKAEGKPENSDILHVRENSLTPSMESVSSNGSADNIMNANLRISPSRKIHVFGKRKAPKAPMDEFKDKVDNKTSEGITKIQEDPKEENDKSKKKSASSSTMSKLMNFPGKLLPFLGKSDGSNDKIQKNEKVPKNDTINVMAEDGTKNNLKASSSGVDIEEKSYVANSADKMAKPITETNV